MSGKTQIRITIVVCIIIFVFVCIVPFPSYRDFIVNEANFHDYTPQQMLQMELFDPYRCGDAVIGINMRDLDHGGVNFLIYSFIDALSELAISIILRITYEIFLVSKISLKQSLKASGEKTSFFCGNPASSAIALSIKSMIGNSSLQIKLNIASSYFDSLSVIKNS